MKNKGFTLIELLVVIVIIGILATISTASFREYMNDARESKRITTAKNIYDIIQAEIVLNDGSPTDFDNDSNNNDFNVEFSGLAAAQGFDMPTDLGDYCVMYGHHSSSNQNEFFVAIENSLPTGTAGSGSGAGTGWGSVDVSSLSYTVFGPEADTVKTALEGTGTAYHSYFQSICNVSDSGFFNSATGLNYNIIRVNP